MSEAHESEPDYLGYQAGVKIQDWVKAAKHARRFAEKYPDRPSAHAYLGNALYHLQLYEQSEIVFKTSLSLDPEEGFVWWMLGRTQDSQKKTKESRDSWERSARMQPESSWVWGCLARSYLKEQEFNEAVRPMKVLRKLDREEFERLISIIRTFQNPPADLRTLLTCFNVIEKGESLNDLPDDPKKLAFVLVSSFLRHGEDTSVQTELDDYAAKVNPYFEQGARTKTYIAKDITSYRAQWPMRTLELIKVESAKRNETNNLEASFRVKFRASNGKETRTGTLVQGIRFTITDGRWLVSGVKTIERMKE